MAYPGEQEHIEYMQYVERVANGDEQGPQLTKAEWRKRRKDEKPNPNLVKVNAMTGDE